ncbi:MAG: UDP-glucose 4-epimerase GalE [Chitinophagales bacterium]
MKKILVTGGAGYIGSHTIVDLVENGFDVISIDNFSNSFPSSIENVSTVLERKIKNYNIDLCDLETVEKVFEENSDIVGIIHFAAFKYVNESVEQPLKYYHNNLTSLNNVLTCCEKYNVRHFVFSSSCSVYGNAAKLPVTEQTPLAKAESPYAQTKVIGEQIIGDFLAQYPLKSTLLRYFNPVGAHPSGKIGENPKGIAQNLLPRITGTALGKYEQFVICGSDYETRDGTCIRDYIHVSDIAHAHTLALQWLISQDDKTCEVFNIGSGNGVTVKEMVNSFESVSGEKLNYIMGERRHGDVVAIYADNTKANTTLGWKCQFTLDSMMSTAWQWDKSLHKE